VTAALIDEFPPPGGWTTDDLDALPQDGRRRELIDGVLIVSPSPTNIHQKVGFRLAAFLDESCPEHLDVTHGVEIRMSRRRSLTPDVLVTTAEAAARWPSTFAPHEVVLAVEIMSPSSVTMDRVTKPAMYAEAGIPFYWRIELDAGLRVYTHTLASSGDVYTPAETFIERLVVEQPWPIELPFTRILR
jgi:Uma2 family endonuclease